MADPLYVPQVDYTSRDYSSIRDDLIATIPNFAPQWVSRDATDFGIVLVELFAYMGDLLNYYIDRAANESFIDSSTQRETVLRLAQLLNYTPSDVSPSTGSVTLTNSATSAAVVKAGTLFSTTADGTNTQITFELNSDVTISAASGSTYGTAPGTVTQGVTVYNELVGTSTGDAYQTFPLAHPGVLTNSTFYVYAGNILYQKVDHLLDYNADDPVFSIYTDGTGITNIQFGDGVSGRVPPNGTAINVTYRYTDTPGSLGNILPNTLTVVISDKNNQPVNDIQVTNAAAFSGGADSESTASVRVNAPLALRSLNRAVTLKDYAQLAVHVNGVSKAIAAASVYTQVTVFIAAAGGYASGDDLKNSVFNYLSTKVPPNTSLAIKDFTPVYPYLTVTVNVLPQYEPTIVQAQVTEALYTLFSYDNVVFNDIITQGDIYSTCKSIDGVAYVTITGYEKQYTVSASPTLVGGVTDLSCNIDEVPILESTYIKVTTAGGIS
jgi:uncharacterized phage protein gp47/JayE